VLLALTLALEFTPRTLTPRANAPRALELLVGAKGPLLPAGLVGAGSERIGEAMRVGQRTLVGDGGAGLRACFVEFSGALRDVRRHDIGLAAGLASLAHDLGRAREGDVLLLASSGSLAPREESARLAAQREALLAELGARAHPGRRTPESWALLALRGARGWIPLAEGTSASTGVVLAFTLAAERTLPPGFVGDFVELAPSGGVEVALERELADAEVAGHAETRAEGRVGGRAFPVLLQQPGAEGARVTWRNVTVGEGSGFLAWVGLADERSSGSDGVDFELRLDGELVRSAPVAPGAPWKPFQVDLRPWAGRTLTLELALAPRASTQGDVALWGRPMLVHGYERSPLEVWAEGR
jgi:hypothetical protein